MNAPYTKTKRELIGLAWILWILALALASLAGWLLPLMGDNCVLTKEADAHCWLYASQWDWFLDLVEVLLASLCALYYWRPLWGGRKMARDAVIGVLLFNSVRSVLIALQGADGLIFAIVQTFYVVVPFLLARWVMGERAQTFSAWLSGVFKSRAGA
jgi:hypothetical protein